MAKTRTMNIRPNAWPNRLLISLVIGAVILLTVIALLSRAFGENELRVAKPAPAFVLKDAHGQTIKLADFKNRALIVWFLVTSDKPCQKQMGILNDLVKACGETNLAVLGLALDQTSPQASKIYAEQQHLYFTLLPAYYEMVQAFGSLTSIPTLFVIDKEQNIIQTYVGVTQTNVLDADVKAILRQ